MLRKEVAEFSRMKAGLVRDELLAGAEQVGGVRLIAARVDLDPETLKNLAFELKSAGEDIFLVLASEADGKASLTVGISDALVKSKSLNAGAIVRELAREIGGGGGGQPNMATAGGKNPAGIPTALAKARTFLE